MFIDYKISRMTKSEQGFWTVKVRFYEGDYKMRENWKGNLTLQYVRSNMTEEKEFSFDPSFTEQTIKYELNKKLKEKENIADKAIPEENI